jgi:hypothetical protein
MMNTLASVRTNILYNKDKDGNYIKHLELILLVDKPQYRYSNEGSIVRERHIEQQRFVVSEGGMSALIELLGELKDIDESDLQP